MPYYTLSNTQPPSSTGYANQGYYRLSSGTTDLTFNNGTTVTRFYERDDQSNITNGYTSYSVIDLGYSLNGTLGLVWVEESDNSINVAVSAHPLYGNHTLNEDSGTTRSLYQVGGSNWNSFNRETSFTTGGIDVMEGWTYSDVSQTSYETEYYMTYPTSNTDLNSYGSNVFGYFEGEGNGTITVTANIVPRGTGTHGATFSPTSSTNRGYLIFEIEDGSIVSRQGRMNSSSYRIYSEDGSTPTAYCMPISISITYS